jgi:hypothetical protein
MASPDQDQAPPEATSPADDESGAPVSSSPRGSDEGAPTKAKPAPRSGSFRPSEPPLDGANHRKELRFWELETRGLTAAFWGAIVAFTVAFWVTPYLPLIDYHQHVAIAAIMQRMFAGGEERALYDINLITYNGGFHVMTALLSYVMPAEHAGRLVMSAYPFLFGSAVLGLCRAAHRPRWYALLALPVVYSRGMAWGFANWNLTFPVALLGIGYFIRYSRGEKHTLVKLLAISVFCAYGHVLAMLCLCAGIGVVQLSRVRALGPTWGARFMRLLQSPLPVMPGVVWCVFVYRYQTRSSFSNWAEASFEGLDDPLWFKIRHVFDMATGNLWDMSDTILVALAMGVALILSVAGSPEPPSSSVEDNDDARALRWLAVFFTLCYFVIPKVFIATWFIYERFPPLAIACLAAALPLRLFPHRDELRASAAGFAVAASLNTVRAFATMGDQADASAIIDAIPAGRKLIAVTHDATTERISREVYVHLPALYQARRVGEIAYTFTKFESMPVHYKPGKAPPTVQPGFEWDGMKYDVHAPWARAYDITLVRTGPGEIDPAPVVFRDERSKVRLLARRGRFFLYDTTLLSVTEPGSWPDQKEPLRHAEPRARCRGHGRAVLRVLSFHRVFRVHRSSEPRSSHVPPLVDPDADRGGGGRRSGLHGARPRR